PGREHQPNQAEIEQLACPVGGQHGILGFDVQVKSAMAVDVGQGLGHLSDRAPHALYISCVQCRVQLLSLDKLHRKEMTRLTRKLLKVVDLRDVSVAQLGERTKLGPK